MTKTHGMAGQRPTETKHVDLVGVKPEEEAKPDLPVKVEGERQAAVGE